MKSLTMTLLSALGVTGVHAQQKDETMKSQPKSIVVFFSRSGNVEKLAHLVSDITGAPLVKLEPEKPYPNAYRETTEVVKDQMNQGIVPPIKPVNINFDDYDVIYLGSPTWWGHISRPMERFLSDYKIDGKRLMLFTSHGGSGEANTADDIRRLCPKSKVSNIAFYGSGVRAEAQLKNWIPQNFK